MKRLKTIIDNRKSIDVENRSRKLNMSWIVME